MNSPITSDTDIYLAANELIKEHGLKGAADYSADRIATLMELKDDAGVAVWRRIRGALLDLSDIRFKDDAAN
jgi:hypothetical protein